MSGDSHTGFGSAVFSVGAAGGALMVSLALVAGVRNVLAQRAHDWSAWTRAQLERAINLSEGLRRHLAIENEELRAENARLRALVRKMTVR